MKILGPFFLDFYFTRTTNFFSTPMSSSCTFI